MNLTCRFEGEDVGTLSAPAEVPGEVPLPFVPLRSVAHLRLAEALAGERVANVDLRGAGFGERRRVLAMTSRTLILAAREGPG